MSTEDKEDKKGAKRQQAERSTAGDPSSGYSETSAEMESRRGRIAGCVFYDVNGNGQFDPGEPGLEGLRVELTATYQRPIKPCTKTDSNGCYSFDGLAPGDYCLEFPESICIKYADQAITYADAYPPQQTTDEQSFQSRDEGESDRESSRPKTSSVLQAAPCQETTIKLKPSGACGNKVCIQINGGTETVNFGYMLATSCIFGYVFRETDADEICDKASARYAIDIGSTALRNPFEGVPVALLSNDVPVASTSTDDAGYFQFQNVGFGNFSLQFPREFGGKSLGLASDALPILVLPGVALGPNIITYDGPLATISGKFELLGGAGVSDLTATLVEVNPASGHAPRKFSATSGIDGAFVFYNVPKGLWTVDVPPAVPSGISGIDFTLDESIRLKCPLKVVGSISIPPFVFKSGILFDLLANKFQLLLDANTACCTPHAMQPVLTALPVAGSTGPVAFGDVINNSLTNILGASISSDPARIVSQLTSAFQQEQRNGKTYYTWRPRGGATSLDSPQSVQVSGTQAAFYQQAKDLQERINRLLDAAEPTFLDPDEEEIATFKEDIRGSLENIVAEFGRGGGALQQRVDVLIINLKRDTTDLKAALGINPVATPEREMDIGAREQNEANFALLEAYVKDLTTAWNSYRTAINAFGSTAQITTFKGTALARLLWAIEAIPSAVQEVYAAMDFVSFGPVDRRVTSIGNNSATVEQLLLWIETSASTDWPNRLVRGGARLNEVEAVKQEANAQRGALTTLSSAIGLIIPAGAGTVSPALDELGRDLSQVVKLATGIKP